MLAFLKNHPFGVDAYFKTSVVLTFAIPKNQLENVIPECLTLDTYDDKWAFVAIALVQTQALRPTGFPTILGNDFTLIGYRVFVRYINQAGKRLRGLYILKSETDKKKMEFLGNLFTHYKYTTTDVQQVETDNDIQISSIRSGLSVTLQKGDDIVPLPLHSPFNNWKEARRFAGPLPFTFSFDAINKEVLIIEGVRENWIPTPIKVVSYQTEFFNSMEIENPVLASAFIVSGIPYHWKKGKIEKWNP